jgi:hypothetical protein
MAGAIGMSTSASAGGAAETKVTIKGPGDVYGYVKSPKVKCMDDRKVTVFKQKGARGGGNDVKMASDNASLNGDRYQWSVGNPGIQGKFYARAGRIPGCKADNSKTISSGS